MWTQEMPAEPGWYWNRVPYSHPRVVEIAQYGSQLVVAYNGRSYELKLFPGQFVGPIPPPLPTATPVEAAGETKAPVHGVVGGGWDG